MPLASIQFLEQPLLWAHLRLLQTKSGEVAGAENAVAQASRL